MLFREFEVEVREVIVQALESLGYPGIEPELLVSGKSDLGDLSCAVALKLAKDLKKPPVEIAETIVASINQSGTRDLVEEVSAHPSGYLNFRLRWDRFAFAAISEARSGTGTFGQGRRLLIEHTNVNPNKALHIGHARNLVLGDSLVRVMKKLGNAVQTVNYVDDSGAQVADVIVGLRFKGFSDEPPAGMKFDVYCGDVVYTQVNRMYETDPGLKEKQRLVLQEIEKGQGEVYEYAQKIVLRILADQLKTCWRLGARYDLLNWESHILATGIWDDIFERLKAKGIAVYEKEGKNAGCWVLRDKELEEDKVLVRSDGTVLYVAKDIPYAAWKIGLIPDPFKYKVYTVQSGGQVLWTSTREEGEVHPGFGNAEEAITVIDVRQSNLQKIVSRVLERLEGGQSERYVHRGYEVVSLSKRSADSLGMETGEKEFVHMKGRKGTYINADTILDSLRSKAYGETKKRNPEESGDWLANVAEKMAVAAFRFELLKQDPDKMIAFDIESSLELQGETGPYLLYSYARALRILEKAGVASHLTRESAGRLIHPKEVELVKALSMFDMAVIEAGEYLNPKEVARYAHRISALLNEFYEVVPVNSEPDEKVKGARLALLEAFAVTLKESLRLIGIETLEKV
ncbi:MAG: arginine--tRNA ligase [Thaumarchaeota archaeon]|nr:arginine--tRNA ligase [Nitrososphaerota archaeon]